MLLSIGIMEPIGFNLLRKLVICMNFLMVSCEVGCPTCTSWSVIFGILFGKVTDILNYLYEKVKDDRARDDRNVIICAVGRDYVIMNGGVSE